MHSTEIEIESASDLGPLRIHQPPGTWSLTPGSRICLRAVAGNRDLLEGTGLEWGAGLGALSILAARLPSVARILGLDISAANVRAARRNAVENGVGEVVTFIEADGYEPRDAADRDRLRALEGRSDFLLANPPATPDGDGFGFRRRVLRGGAPFLRPGGVALVMISSQYGGVRIRSLEREAPRFRWQGPVATTDWTPFDLHLDHLRRNLRTFVQEEERGGLRYHFRSVDGASLDARDALERFRATGESPLTRWQVHRFDRIRTGGSGAQSPSAVR